MDVTFAIDLTDVDRPYAELSFCLDGQWHQQRIELATTYPPYGGRRFWFLCPQNGRRARLLYLPDGEREFASRIAHSLTYRSQGERVWARKVTRVQNIRAKLKGDPSIAAPLPGRPSRMHGKTYERLRQAIEPLNDEVLKAHNDRAVALDARLARLQVKLSRD
jgi:hypothetical protein